MSDHTVFTQLLHGVHTISVHILISIPTMTVHALIDHKLSDHTVVLSE